MIQHGTEKDNWYFAYGSNLSKQQMLRRTGSIPPSQVVWLDNYQFAFRRVLDGNDVFATLLPKKGSRVYGVAYQCSQHAMMQLDHFEGVSENCYRKELVDVTIHDGESVRCIVYIGQAFTNESARPSASYWDSIRTGAQEHQLPTEYVNTLTQLAEKSS